MGGDTGKLGLYDLAVERLGQDRVDEIVCDAIGTDAASYPRVLESYRRDGYVMLNMFLDYGERDAIEEAIRARATGLYERFGDRGDAPSGQELYQELEDTTMELEEAWADTTWNRRAEIAGRVSAALNEALGLEESVRDTDIQEDLDDYGLYPDLEVGSILECMSFPVTLMLDAEADRAPHDMGPMGRTFDAALKALDDAGGPAGDGMAVEKGAPGFSFDDPAEAEASSLGWLCRTQGTSIGEVVRGGGGAFGESLRREILDAGPCEGCYPHLIMMCTLDARQFCDLTAAACGDRGAGRLLEAVPGDIPGCGFTGIGIFDPVGGAGGVYDIEIDRPIEIGAQDIGHVMPDYHTVRDLDGLVRYNGWYTVQECCGFTGPAVWGHPVEAPEPAPSGIEEVAGTAARAVEARSEGAGEPGGMREPQER